MCPRHVTMFFCPLYFLEIGIERRRVFLRPECLWLLVFNVLGVGGEEGEVKGGEMHKPAIL